VGIDPTEAQTVWPWWGGAPGALADDAMIAGANMPDYLLNADWSTYGHAFVVAGGLQPTGTLLDNSMLMTIDAARSVASTRAARQREAQQRGDVVPATTAGQALVANPGDGLSAVLVLAAPGVAPDDLAVQIARLQPALDAVPAPAYVTALRGQLRALAAAARGAAAGAFLLAALALALALLPRRLLRRAPRRAAAPAVSVRLAPERSSDEVRA